jgi:hypothetical protein
MLERDIIQHKGFRNIKKDRCSVGFQVGIRQPNYRGSWLSEIRFDSITVDGDKYEAGDVSFVIGGIEYTYTELADKDRLMWALDEPCYIRVMKHGGLSTGAHDVRVVFWQIRSYIPVRINNSPFMIMNDPKFARELVLVD